MVLDAQGPRFLLGVGIAHFGGVARRHQHRFHPFRSQRVDGDGQGQRRIDATGQSQHRAGEPVLVHIIAHAQHNGLINRGFLGQFLGNFAGTGFHRRADAEIHRIQTLDAKRSPLGQFPAPVDHLRIAVEHQFVLPANQVGVKDGQAIFDRPLSQDLQPQPAFAGVKGRGVQIEQQLRTGLGGLAHRPGLPHILADGDADPRALEFEHQRFRARHEIAFLVEHTVIGQTLLVIDRPHPPVGDDGGRIAQSLRRRGGIADDGGYPLDFGAKPPHGRFHLAHETGSQQQIFRGIAGDGQLREYDRIGPPAIAGLSGGDDDLFGVAGDIADQEVKLGHDDPEIGNRINHRVYPSICRPWPPFQPNSVKTNRGAEAPLSIPADRNPDWVSRGNTSSSPRRCRPASGRSWRRRLPAPRTCRPPCPCHP